MTRTFMSTAELAPSRDEFSELADRYRRELQVHCYRMLGSLEDAEDLVQETFLRAWRWRSSLRSGSAARAWLYRIATNACLDALRARSRRHQATHHLEPTRLHPDLDVPHEAISTTDAEPEAEVASRETIELVFLAGIQHLPPRQRAVLVLRDVFGLSAKETARLLETSPASVTSALQRARATLGDHLPESRLEWAVGSESSREERALLQRYLEATERADAEAIAEILHGTPRFGVRTGHRRLRAGAVVSAVGR